MNDSVGRRDRLYENSSKQARWRTGWRARLCVALALWATTAIALSAQTFGTLHSFDSADGALVYAGLTQATDGNLYGVATLGGANDWGTFFKITPSGTLTVLYSFCAQTGCPNGAEPGAVIQGGDGNFYGTTEIGGASNGYCSVSFGCGTVFQMSPGGTLKTIYSFCSQSGCADGDEPMSGLIQAIDGNYYGTTPFGGSPNSVCSFGCGTTFKITPGGTLTTVYNFCSQTSCLDGEYPLGPLSQASNGNLYGLTQIGGEWGYGTVFELTLSSVLTTLHSFLLWDGANGSAGPVQAQDGTFYGTTMAGGLGLNGTIYTMNRAGTLTRLYSFCSQTNCTDGSQPRSGLVEGTDGNFYGTTSFGGDHGYGTIFKITPAGVLTTLHSFDGNDGANPYAGLTQDTNGKLYGTTSAGGTSRACKGGCGTIFALSVGLPPFVETQPASGSVGKQVELLGTTLTGATSVTFNGTPATFTVEAGSLIRATVPAGATTGPVQVVTPSGTLTSNVSFQVTP